MFEQSILAQQNLAHKTRALAASFGVQTLVVATALLIPLILGDHMPQVHLGMAIAAPVRLQPEPVPVTATTSTSSAPSIVRAPTKIFPLASLGTKPASPYSATIISDAGQATSDGPPAIGVPGGITRDLPTITTIAIAPTHTTPPAPPKVEDKPRVVGGDVQAAKLIRKIVPEYPQLAKQARVSGTVRLTSVIAKDGSVVQLEVVSGNPLLIPAALAAVKQWIYRPTFLNGQPVEVISPIDVIFTLSQ
jgi:periplasmic protein TonB